MKKILVVTGSRGEWGYLRPILALWKESDAISFDILATNMHLLSSHGNTYREIENDGFSIKYKINMAMASDDYYSHSKGLSLLMQSLSDIFLNERYDLVLLSGDRGEQLAAAMCASYCYIPVAHIQAGEVSGNIDGLARHAIGKLAHIHFASNKDAEKRLLALGEQDFRVKLVGAPQIDDMVNCPLPSNKEIASNIGVSPDDVFILSVLHPVTENLNIMSEEAEQYFNALSTLNSKIIHIMPNNDVGHDLVNSQLGNFEFKEIKVFKNLSRETYLWLLKNCACIVGNSSSGILEAPTYRTPCVNIGRRQKGRFQGHNVINCNFEKTKIIEAIAKAVGSEFKASLADLPNDPYGSGDSAKKITEVVLSTSIDRTLLIKELTL